ncbi:sce7726 family protein [Pseudomonas kurunegalensis]|uniref:sce7726 family protein n=1 Tax=Pseudomonas kurunegalensis TaxID=485880 RepID=UPI003558D33C
MFTYTELARTFSSKRIAELSLGNTNFIEKIAKYYSESLPSAFTLADVYNSCYEDIRKNYRNEYYLKNTIAQKILIGKHSLNTTTALTEFRVGKSKADCIIINGHSTCYEIKSNYDNLDRLDSQLEQYKKLFDKVYVVAEESQLEKIQNFDLKDVGLLQLTRRGTLSTVKEAGIITRPIDAKLLIRSLRVSEYTEIVKNIYGQVPNLANTEIFFECEALFEGACPNLLRNEFRRTVKVMRKNNSSFLQLLPAALLNAGISYKLNKQQQCQLIKSLNNIYSKDALCTTQSLEASSLN